jgi:predicted permease
MRMWQMLQVRLRSFLRRGERETDLDAELQAHLEQEIAHLEAGGLPADEARRQAHRTFGGVEQVREACRDARGTATLDAIARDVRHSTRRLLRDWRFTTAAIVILGLGIGANTAIFSVVNAVLFRPQPFADADRLVDVYENTHETGAIWANSYPAYLAIAEFTDVFASTTASLVPIGVTYRDGGGVRSAVAEYASPTHLDVLGLRPAQGRWFTAADDAAGAPVVVVLGYETWLRKFNGDPSVLGRTIQIEGVPATVVGVGPAGFDGTLNVAIATDFWMPIRAVLALGGPPGVLDPQPRERAFLVKGRLRPGVGLAQAQAAMNGLAARLAAETPRDGPAVDIVVLASRDVRVHPQLDPFVKWLSAVLLVAVGLVLAIACSNLATLLLVRGAARAQEISIRLAVGASRGQLVRYLLTESVLLAVGGGAAGCLIAWWAMRISGMLNLPVEVSLGLDYRVLAFTIGLSLLTGIGFGLAPALSATRFDVNSMLRHEGDARSTGGRTRLKNALIVFQVGVSVLLLGATSVFLQLIAASQARRTGYAVDGVAMLETDGRYAGYTGTSDTTNVYEMLRQRIAALPGVQAAVVTRGLPMQANGVRVVVDGTDAGSTAVVPADFIWAGPGFFDALQIPILYGRALDTNDRADTPRVAVISEAMARRYFGTPNAVGRRFRFEQEPNGWIEVVGIARDTGTADLSGDLVDPSPYLFYRSYAQSSVAPTVVVARTSLDASGLVGGMQREIRDVDPALPVLSAQTMEQYLADSLKAERGAAAFLGTLAAVGVCLASVGLYAVVAFAVSRRSREIGIRMALGARGWQVVGSVARDVGALVGFGTLAGLALSVLVILVLRSVAAPAPGVTLYRPTVDPLMLIGIALGMALIAMVAAFVPARRAALMDPLVALRHE